MVVVRSADLIWVGVAGLSNHLVHLCGHLLILL